MNAKLRNYKTSIISRNWNISGYVNLKNILDKNPLVGKEKEKKKIEEMRARGIKVCTIDWNK